MKVWRDTIEPPSSDYTWYRLNEEGGFVGTFKNIGGKWILQKKKKSDDVDLSSIIGDAPEQYDTLGEIAGALTNLSNVAYSGDYADLSNKPNTRTFKEFKSSWPTGTTLEAFCSTVINDSDANVGNAYLGGLSCSGLPTGMGQGDVVVEIIGTNDNKVVKLTLTSTDVSPYHWEGCYWQGSFRGWKTFELDSNKVTSISSNSTDEQYPSAKATYNEIHPAVQSTQPQGGFLPNVVYVLGTITGSVTFALANAISGIVNHYYWTFETDSTAPTITWPSNITWNGGGAPTINASKHYEISIFNGVGTYIEV